MAIDDFGWPFLIRYHEKSYVALPVFTITMATTENIFFNYCQPGAGLLNQFSCSVDLTIFQQYENIALYYLNDILIYIDIYIYWYIYIRQIDIYWYIYIYTICSGPVCIRDLGPSQYTYKDRLSRYGDFHYKDKTVVKPSYLYNGNPYIGKTAVTSLYWDGPQNFVITIYRPL